MKIRWTSFIWLNGHGLPSRFSSKFGFNRYIQSQIGEHKKVSRFIYSLFVFVFTSFYSCVFYIHVSKTFIFPFASEYWTSWARNKPITTRMRFQVFFVSPAISGKMSILPTKLLLPIFANASLFFFSAYFLRSRNGAISKIQCISTLLVFEWIWTLRINFENTTFHLKIVVHSTQINEWRRRNANSMLIWKWIESTLPSA